MAKRVRAIGGEEDTAQGIQKKLRELAIQAYLENEAANAHAAAYKKKRGELLAQMKSMKLKSKIFDKVDLGNGRVISLEAVISAPEREKADVAKLAGLVDKEVFMQIVSATKTDVVALAGQAVFEQIKSVSHGEENVSVKPLK